MSIGPLSVRPASSGANWRRRETMSMRFLSMIRINENSGQVPNEQLMHDMGKLIDEMTRNGVLIRTAGLRPTAEGTRVRQRRGTQSVVDRPFTEHQEVIGGLAIVEAKTIADAIERTKRSPPV